MKKIILIISLVIITNIWAVEEFTIAKSRDDKVCNYMLNLLNNDLRNDGSIDLKKHEEFNWHKWDDSIFMVPYDKVGKIKKRISYFDINNDGKEETVLQDIHSWHYYENKNISYTYKMSKKELDGQWLPKFYNSVNGKILASVQKNMTNYTLVEKVHLYSRKIDTIHMTLKYPTKIYGKYYISLFGDIKFQPEEDMLQNGNTIILLEFTDKNMRNDLCILIRNIKEGN